MEIQHTRQHNDCGACALVNVAHLLEIPLSYETAKIASGYDKEGYGSSYCSRKWLLEHYPP